MTDFDLLVLDHLSYFLALSLFVGCAVEYPLLFSNVDLYKLQLYLHGLVLLSQVQVHVLKVVDLLVEHIHVSN